MKVLLIILAVVFVAFTSEKEYSFKMKEGEVVMLYNTLQFSKQAILSSDVPTKTAVKVIGDIDSLSKVIVTQYQLQIPDSLKKKK